MLLKGKISGGFAPPFLSIGDDSEDEIRNSTTKSSQSIQINASVDSDDGNKLLKAVCRRRLN